MPFFVSIPLGPFRYVKSIGGRKPHRTQTLSYWLFGIFALEAALWLLAGVAWVFWILIQLAVTAVQRRRGSERATPPPQ